MLPELKSIGLSDKEARVYLAMLELGPATMLEIATKADINRPTAYVQIEALKKMGLVSTQTKGKKHLFMAESPAQLEVILDREEKGVEQKKDELIKILPELSTLYNLADEKPLVRFFEGKEGLLRMQEEFLKTKDKTIYGIFAVDDVFKIFPNHLDSYTPKRIAKKIRSKVLYTSEKGPFLKSDEQMLREARFIDPKNLPFSIDMTIFDDSVAISSLRGKVGGTIITNSEITKSFRGIFELLWRSAK